MGFQLSRSAGETLAYPYPGRSTKTTLESATKKLMRRVRPGVFDVFTRFLRPSRLFISELLPTLERPQKATSGSSESGYSSGRPALVTNSAFWICMARKSLSPPGRGPQGQVGCGGPSFSGEAGREEATANFFRQAGPTRERGEARMHDLGWFNPRLGRGMAWCRGLAPATK